MLPWEAAKVRDIPLESGGRKGHLDEKCNQAEKRGRLCAPRGVRGTWANHRASAAMCGSLH